MAFAVVMVVADEKKVSRMGTSVILNQGGTTTTDGRTVVVSGSPTNEYRINDVVATITVGTAYTNNFTIPWIVNPMVVKGIVNGQNQNYGSGVVITVTTTNVIVSGMDTSLTNNIPIFMYGYKNTGVFQ